MTEYLKPKFSVPLGGKAYGDGWDRIFGKKEEEEPPPPTEPEEEKVPGDDAPTSDG